MYNIFDCSNSAERPAHRGGGGPVMNDIMRYLQENAASYNYNFVTNLSDADIVITNDIFPSDVLASGKPLVKRMAGPFWQREYASRNDALNAAAQQANAVIFITEYSKQQYIHCFGDNLKWNTVVTHWVDPNVFYDRKYAHYHNKFMFTACATDWSRKEKRLSAILDFANQLKDECDIVLIGTLNGNNNPHHILPNIYSMGYSSPERISSFLNLSDGFLNLSYRDAATKTVCQAINCGLPVLYAASGGVKEMVRGYGTSIYDPHPYDMEDFVPDLDIQDMLRGYEKYRENFDLIKSNLSVFDSQQEFNIMLDGYFSVIDNVLQRRIV